MAGLLIEDDGLSRVHASIHRNEEAVWILDEQSTNGSYVNGLLVQPGGTLLRDGDSISLGNTLITVEIYDPDGRAPDRAQSIQGQQPLSQEPHVAAASFQASPGVNASVGSFWSPPVIAAASATLIILLAALGLLLSSRSRGKETARNKNSRQRIVGTVDTSELASKVPLIDPSDVPEPVTAESEQAEESEAATDERFKQGLLEARQDRGEPMGGEAPGVEIPAELKQYAERGRFLAIQTAKAQEQGLRIPHDFAELAEMKRESQFVELKSAGESYVLYAIAGGVTDEPFNHFDKASGKSVPIYTNAAEFQNALASMNDGDERKEFIASFYKSSRSRQLVLGEYNLLVQLARNFDGRSFNISDGTERRAYKKRLLSMLRPPARQLLEELALAYKTKFNRPLPISSLVRTEQYQRELSERNANAARNALPPHTTGLAFDVSYRYMTAAEQNFLMAEIARLEKGGRVEALRENNNSFHIFVFPDGRPPSETALRRVMGGS
jgi:hypothetical protein